MHVRFYVSLICMTRVSDFVLCFIEGPSSGICVTKLAKINYASANYIKLYFGIYLSNYECSISFLQVIEKSPPISALMINMLFCWYKQLKSCNRAVGKISNVFTLRWLILAGPVRYLKRKANQKFFSKRKCIFEMSKNKSPSKITC